MNYLEILCQPTVLESLVPHLDHVGARAYFSSCRALHLALKDSAAVRYAVWLLRRKVHWALQLDPFWFEWMMLDIVQANDIHAARLACDLPPPIDVGTYYLSMGSALSDAVAHGHCAMVELLIERKRATMTPRAVARAFAAGNLDMVKYLAQHHPEHMARISTAVAIKRSGRRLLGTHGLTPDTVYSVNIYIDGDLESEFLNVDDDRIATHKWLRQSRYST